MLESALACEPRHHRPPALGPAGTRARRHSGPSAPAQVGASDIDPARPALGRYWRMVGYVRSTSSTRSASMTAARSTRRWSSRLSRSPRCATPARPACTRPPRLHLPAPPAPTRPVSQLRRGARQGVARSAAPSHHLLAGSLPPCSSRAPSGVLMPCPTLHLCLGPVGTRARQRPTLHLCRVLVAQAGLVCKLRTQCSAPTHVADGCAQLLVLGPLFRLTKKPAPPTCIVPSPPLARTSSASFRASSLTTAASKPVGRCGAGVGIRRLESKEFQV